MLSKSETVARTQGLGLGTRDAGCPVQYCQRRLGPRLTAKTIPSLSPLVSEASDFPLSQGRAALRGSQAEVSYRTGA